MDVEVRRKGPGDSGSQTHFMERRTGNPVIRTDDRGLVEGAGRGVSPRRRTRDRCPSPLPPKV